MNQDQAQNTGTRNETYDVIAVLYHALQGAENCQRYIKDARNDQARSFFEQALQLQRQLADQGKQVLQQVLQNDSGGGSAFGWQQSEQQQSQPQAGDFIGSSPSMGSSEGGQRF